MSLESGALVRRWRELWGNGAPRQAWRVAGGLGTSVNSGISGASEVSPFLHHPEGVQSERPAGLRNK